ncbi:ANTAR domain-containing protein [Streptomyces sp. CA-256286]|uniref:ANTAR domain-containing protein n=1 Tax=Streptomyces sp. CA-256286 TaxID=2801033 RepID=UPI001A99BE6C|nr:ANTAR domain-containing protein [Streptomyces sp. CA-256286]
MAEPTSLARQAPDEPAVDGEQPSPGGEGELRERVRQLEQALASHVVVDQARGVLMALTRCTPEEAWDMLVRISQHANVKARLVAEAVVTATQGGEVPPGVSRHLKKALKQGKDRPDRPGHANASQR